MMRRIAAVLLALVAVFGVAVSAPQPAAADGIIGNGIEGACRIATGPILGTILGGGGKTPGSAGSITGSNLCDKVGDAGEKKIKEAWKAVWDSVLGDVVNAAADVVKWVIKKVLTVALLGPSVDLAGTGLWSGKATLAGMLVWLGLVIAAFGMIWQLGKMAVTGQTKHAGRALVGFGENILLSAVGVGMFAILLTAGDALTAGLVDATFNDDGSAYEQIVATLVPNAVSNPITMLCIVAVLLLIGFIQLIMVFLRQSAIPIIALLLPVAGGGRAGGDATRKWAPRLITSGLVVITYKPILAVIICTGFAEFGHSKTLAEWLRGCATLVLAILAPGPLTRIFAPFGEAVGGGMAAGGMSGAFAGAAGYLANRGSQEAGSGGGSEPASAVEHARYVEQSMGNQNGQGGDGGDGSGGDAQAQAQRNEANARVPSQGGSEAATAGAGAAATTGAGAQTAAAGAAGTAATAAAGPVGIGIQVLDGVNDAVQGASNTMGNGGNS
ncbi:hypothetical protein HEP84_35855 [Streptomyces sp. RLB1-33]|nr:hypothetical protein [Streptomyces sp. RLB1-33]QIY73728.1 hypothetical protein HEP84_35855 [Streptomyces sp. RLB1-33]